MGSMGRFAGNGGSAPARRRWGFGALVGWALLSCVSPGGRGPLPLDTDTIHRLQRESLGFLIHAGNPLPPAPTAEELAGVARVVASADPEEAELLREYYGEELDLLVYATRDSDGDGIHDFRVSDYYGKFLEGDVDLDGDGLRNVLDAAPYDSNQGGRDADGDGVPDPGSFADANSNGVPDTVDWALGNDRPEAAQRQRELFLRHGILLVDRSAAFTEELARSVYDVITRILRPVSRDQLPALRVVAAEETCLLAPELDDETQAMMISQTQTLVVYRIGIDHPPFIQLGLLAHELAHGYQFSLDFEGIDRENRRIYFPAPNFLERVRPFGWSHQAVPPAEIPDPYLLFTPHYLSLEPTYTYRDETPEAWAEWLEALYAELGDGYLADPRVTEQGIVGDYSLENPWEWHSDNLIAYLFVEIEHLLEQRPGEGPAGVENMRLAATDAWPSFRYLNLAPEVQAHFRKVLPLRDEDLAYFVEAYVEPLAATPGHFTP